MKLHFIKMSPAGNTTLFILDPVPREFHGQIARTLIAPEYLGADQVGFIEKPCSGEAVARLQMMGGEFCGNATRALAVLLVERGRVKASPTNDVPKSWIVPLEVSGYTGILEAEVKKIQAEAHYWSETPIPTPKLVQNVSITVSGSAHPATLVEFPGITHVVLSDVEPSEAAFHEIARQIPPADALGVMFYETQRQFMTPLVSVIKAKSLVWEGSCGSGTVALAATLATQTGERVINLVVTQPGGSITVDIEYGPAGIGEARIKGFVKMIAEGSVFIAN